jgi:hypothetical protein
MSLRMVVAPGVFELGAPPRWRRKIIRVYGTPEAEPFSGRLESFHNPCPVAGTLTIPARFAMLHGWLRR